MTLPPLPLLMYPRESIELVEVAINEIVNQSHVPVTAFDVTLTHGSDRPVTGWAAADTDGDAKGYLLTGDREPGTYVLWARVTDPPQIPIIPVARIDLT